MKKIFTLLFLACLSVAMYAEKQVNGVVVDANGDPVIGASIQAKGSTQGTISDYDGKFEMDVPESVKTLVVSFVGMATQEVAAGKNLRIVMTENSEVIQEVVVTGYGTVAKGAYAGSAQAVKAEDIEKKNPSDITKALAGEVAGVQVVTSSGQPGTVADIRIRGIGSISASTAPLYVVDGIPLEAGAVSSIDPSDIASTTILKDATATSLYGSRGANGVILITTKKGSSNGEDGKIEIDVKAGTNVRLLPMYDVIDSPEDYMVLCWQSLYNQQRWANGKTEAQAVKYANNNLFGANGIPTIYNLWDQSGKVLINPYDAAGNVHPTFDYANVNRQAMYKKMDSWYNALFHSGLKMEATAKISGGNEKLNYYTSFGYLKDQGYYTGSDFQRFNARANVNYQAKKWLKGGLNIQYAYTKASNPGQTSAANNGFSFVNEIPPIYPVYVYDPATGRPKIDPKTGRNMYDYGDNGNENIGEEGGRPYSFGINPAGALEWDQQRTVRHQTIANAFLEFKLYEGLKLTVNAGLQYLNSRSNVLTNPYYGDAANVGRIANAQYNYLYFMSNQLLEYNKTIDEHSIRVMAGHEVSYFNVNHQYGYQKKIALDDVAELSNAISMDEIEGSASSQALQSVIATATYEYDNRYLITANYRADGSSNFAKGHRWGHFGSIGGAWNFTNEHFMEGTTAADWLKNGKLRLSWGVLGNQEIGVDLAYIDRYSLENVGGEKGYIWEYRGNEDLTWERTSTVDLGLEFSLSKWLDVEIDYFYKKTDNMLFPRNVASSLGYGGYYVNDAAMENQGLEFDLKAHLVDMRNIKLDVRFNGGFYRNKMLLMPIDGYENGEPVRQIMSGGMAEGHSTADWYMPHYEGVGEDGQAMYTGYYDANKGGWGHNKAELLNDGDNTGNYIGSVYEYKLKYPNADIQTVSITQEEYNYVGSNYTGKSYMPDLDGGFGLDFEAYGVTLSISCSYRIGGYGYDYMYSSLMHSDEIGSWNWHKDMLNSWTETNTNTNIPRLSNGADDSNNKISDRFLTSNSFLSLNNINLGYKFPKKLIEKAKMNALHVWVAADNLGMITARKGYNPMMSISGSNGYNDYSPLTTIMAGVKVEF